LLANKTDYPLHLGITEAGGRRSGSIKSSIGIGNLLLMGIGDTIRVSLSADPVEEVKAGFQILKSLGIRNKGVTIISCPSCARQNFDVINTVKIIEEKLSHIKEAVSLSIIGCVVNGPGEAKETNIGVTGGGKDFHQIYIDGSISHKMEQKDFINHVVGLVEDYAAKMRI
jgi:(E)-4-hydroxy-3-methylbut-2-enyl-diphosphate synthase